METLLTVPETARRLSLQEDTVRSQLKRGALRGVKRGRVWRVPESALFEVTASSGMPHHEAMALWHLLTDTATHNAAIIEIAKALPKARELIAKESAKRADAYYSTEEGRAELSYFEALDGEPCSTEENDEVAERGEVWDVSVGSEVRPVIVLSFREWPRPKVRACVPLTEFADAHAFFSWSVLFTPTERNNLLHASTADVSHLRSLDQSSFVRKRGRVEEGDLRPIFAAINLSLGNDQ